MLYMKILRLQEFQMRMFLQDKLFILLQHNNNLLDIQSLDYKEHSSLKNTYIHLDR
jgi:hypothetical protein